MPIDFVVEGDNESKPNSNTKKIQQKAMGNIVQLSAAPTTADNNLPEGYFGVYTTGLYLTTNGTPYLVATMVAQ